MPIFWGILLSVVKLNWLMSEFSRSMSGFFSFMGEFTSIMGEFFSFMGESPLIGEYSDSIS